uniref:Uncharacterized protein n=1 Tax=Meloidogyne floridensis TaxID=298350 RepID=A0A915PBI4_9BILA
MFSANRIQALNRQKNSKINMMKEEIGKNLEKCLKEEDEKLIETYTVVLSSKRTLDLALINQFMKEPISNDNYIKVLKEKVEEAKKKHNQKVQILENKKNCLIISTKKQIDHQTKLIEDLFQEHIRKENEALLLFNNEIENTVKDVMCSITKEICCQSENYKKI